ncbi:hypothetical protein BDR22DRAFT_829024 [Usnea florida]
MTCILRLPKYGFVTENPPPKSSTRIIHPPLSQSYPDKRSSASTSPYSPDQFSHFHPQTHNHTSPHTPKANLNPKHPQPTPNQHPALTL